MFPLLHHRVDKSHRLSDSLLDAEPSEAAKVSRVLNEPFDEEAA
jgi:hypothetical protein